MAITISATISGASSKPLARGEQVNGSKSNLFGTQRIQDNSGATKQVDQVETLVEKQQEAASRKSTDAVRKLNDAALFTAVAKNAASEIDRLLEKGQASAEKLQGALSVEDREAIETELGQISSELNKISNQATFNGQSVIEAGSKTFSGSLDSQDGSSSTDFSISVSNISLSQDSLGIDLQDRDAFRNPERLADEIKSARLSVGAQVTKLENAEDQIQETAERAGLSGSAEVEAEAKALTPVAVQEILSSASAEQLVGASGKLNPARVSDLLIEESGEQTAERRTKEDVEEPVEKAKESDESILARIRAERENKSADNSED